MNEPSTSAHSAATYIIRRVPAGLVIALILLRLAAGWHFWREGTKKLAYDPTTGKTRIAFAGTEGFLRGAVGPWKEFYQKDLPTVHDWEPLLALPTKFAPLPASEAAEQAKWNADMAKRMKAAVDKPDPAPLEFFPHGRASKWGEQVFADWQIKVDRFNALPGITDNERNAAKAALTARSMQLADYLAGADSDIADWQHELWRLQEWEGDPTGKDLPFEVARIADKRTETKAGSAAWVASVRDLDASLNSDLRESLTAEHSADSSFVDRVAGATADPKEESLRTKNVIITCVVVGVGACLLLGLFTRVAAVAGIGFLLLVMGAQPPWVEGARIEFFYYQLVEVFALFVLLVAGAGRWAGLDFFLRALFGKRRATMERVSK